MEYFQKSKEGEKMASLHKKVALSVVASAEIERLEKLKKQMKKQEKEIKENLKKCEESLKQLKGEK